jgi:hypothetical protein
MVSKHSMSKKPKKPTTRFSVKKFITGYEEFLRDLKDGRYRITIAVEVKVSSLLTEIMSETCRPDTRDFKHFSRR